MSCSFRRARHRSVAKLLGALDHERLRTLRCFFGGGTAIALEVDEFRESADVDFLCADKTAYRALRELVFDADIDGLFREPIVKVRDTRADMDGIRNFVLFDGMPLKFEIIVEGRIAIADSDRTICGVTTLCTEDAFTEKLLANADRGLDRATASRDLIDLLALSIRHGGIPHSAFFRASEVYGQSVSRTLERTCDLLRDDHAYRAECLSKLDIDDDWAAALTTELISSRWLHSGGWTN